jgi:hypothetical protein
MGFLGSIRCTNPGSPPAADDGWYSADMAEQNSQPPSGPPPTPSPDALPCSACGFDCFWRDHDGGHHCARCQPPSTLALVAAFVGAIKLTADLADDLADSAAAWLDLTAEVRPIYQKFFAEKRRAARARADEAVAEAEPAF